jgi:hypothetical protein
MAVIPASAFTASASVSWLTIQITSRNASSSSSSRPTVPLLTPFSNPCVMVRAGQHREGPARSAPLRVIHKIIYSKLIKV